MLATMSLSADDGTLSTVRYGFTAVSKKAIPAVVFIKSQHNPTTCHTNEGADNPFDNFSDEIFRHFFGSPLSRGHGRAPASPQIAQGSGAIVSPDGYIITNQHVIKDSDETTVTLNNGTEYKAKIIGSDPRTDLAILKIEADNLPFLTFADSDQLEIGEWAIAIGSPFALQSTLTVGVVSAKGRQDLRIVDLEDFIQTDAALNLGNSGGPLLNINGEIIGINTAIALQSGGYAGIGFAIPSNMAKHIIDQLIANGSVNRGYLGIFLQQVDKSMSEALNLDKAEGIIITEVVKDSPAQKAGLKQGDIILEYNRHPIKTMAQFRNEIALMKPNDMVTLKIMRDNKTQEIKVSLESPPTAAVARDTLQLGMEVANVQEIASDLLQKYGHDLSSEGVIITKIIRGGIAERAGLRPGMLILQINQNRIKNAADFNEAMQAVDCKKPILLQLRYQGFTRFVTIKTN